MTFYTKETYLEKLNQNLNVNVQQDIDDKVKAIIEDVRQNKDEALRRYTKTFDRVLIDSFLVSQQDMNDAYLQVSEEVKDALKKAIINIRTYHEKQTYTSFEYENNGRIIGQKITPIEKVGLYIPGGTASYPSTVLMSAIPAMIAGVKDIVLISPPNQEGKIAPSILVAADMLNIKNIFKIGGAQGIAALTFGTQSILKVDKIVGPGNIYVATAKKLVSGLVGIDTIAGPSEVVIFADETSNPVFIAADMLAQAEHDTQAKAICISTSQVVLEAVEIELQRQLLSLSRETITRTSIENEGALILVDSIDEGIKLINRIAPEHLELLCLDAFKIKDRIDNAGAIFIGAYTPEPVGDYMAGPNHTLPTSGVARFSSGLSTYDFLKRTSYVSYSKQAFLEDQQSIIDLAEEEGLTAHAASIKVRL
jgi:histidinol dehydrogenase